MNFLDLFAQRLREKREQKKDNTARVSRTAQYVYPNRH